MADNISALRTMRDAPSLFEQVRTAGQITPEDSYALTNAGESQFTKGLRTGVAGLTAGSFANQALSRELSGDAAYTESRDNALRTMQESAMFAPRVRSLRDINSLGDAGDFASGAVGQGLASMAPTIATALLTRGRGKLGAATGFAGAFGTAYNLERGEAALGQYTDPELAKADVQDRGNAAMVKGGVNAALESIVPASLANSLLRRPAGSYLGHVGREMLTEGATETAQQAVGFGAEKYLDPNRQLDPMELADAFVSGALTGGAASGTMRAPDAVRSAVENVQQFLAGPTTTTPETPAPTPETPSSPPDFAADIDQKMDAAKDAATPQDFIAAVFTPSSEDMAAEDLVPDTEDPAILNAKDPAAAMEARDAKRAERAALYVQELIANTDTPDDMKAQIESMSGNLTDPANQAELARMVLQQRASTKITEAIDDLKLFAKGVSNKVAEFTSKKNLQDIPLEEISPLVDKLAEQLGTQASKAPQLARQLIAAANRIAPDARIDEQTDRRLRGLSTAVDDETLDIVSELSGSDALRSVIRKIRDIPNAASDLQKSPDNTSFFASMLAAPVPMAQQRTIARYVDELGLKIGGMNPTQKKNALSGLANVFGSVKNAQTVVEYYGNLQREAYSREAERGVQAEDPIVETAGTDTVLGTEDINDAASSAEFGALTETDAPAREYGFRSAAAKRPFRRFVAEQLSDGRKRREGMRALVDARSKEDADYALMPYGEYLREQGVAPEAGLAEVRRDIAARRAEHEKRGAKGEDRSRQINELRGEESLLAEIERDQGPAAALNQYEVLSRTAPNRKDLTATDDELKSMQVANRSAPETVVTFRKNDGTELKLSAYSMARAQSFKRRDSGKIDTATKENAQQMFADAVASVLAREDIAGLETDLSNVVLNPQSGEKVSTAAGKTLPPDKLNALRAKGEAKRAETEKRRSIARKSAAADNVRNAAGLEKALADLRAKNPDPENRLSEFEQVLGWLQRAESRAATDPSMRSKIGVMESFLEKRLDRTFPLLSREELQAEMADIAAAEGKELDMDDPKMQEAVLRREVETLQDRAAMVEGTGLETRINRQIERLNREIDNASTRQSSMGATNSARNFTAQSKQDILDEITRIRGKDVKTVFTTFARLGASGEFSMDKATQERVIKIAVNAANPMGVAWHESLHDFFAMLGETPALRSIKKDLIDAGNAPHVKKQLRELLASHPKALKQIEEDAEERVAYMYQFWAEGLLKLGPTGTNIFTRIKQLIKDLLGVVSSDDRAASLLAALHKGKFAEPSLVASTLDDLNRSDGDRLDNIFKRTAPAVADTVHKLMSAAPDRLRAYQNDTLNKLADMFSSERGKLGFIQQRFQQQGKWENTLAGLLKDTTAAQRRTALDNMQAMKVPSSPLEQNIANFLSAMHDYLTDAGVKTFEENPQGAKGKWVPLRQVKNYFPRQFDRKAIESDRKGFSALLQKHGGMTPTAAENVINALTHGTGQLDLVENEHSLGYTPFAQATQSRKLTFIDPSNAAEFANYQSKDIADVLSGYVRQAVHRAEYARMFGNAGEVITDMLKSSGIKDSKELQDIGKTIQGLEGSLNQGSMSASTKELMSSVLTLQNLVALPLSIFSQMVDPIVLAARSGDIRDAGNAFMTAVKRLAGNRSDAEDMANMLGIISQDSVLEAMGDAYGSTYMSKSMRNLNRVFFKYNGMQGWNNSMRIAATAAGERYLIKNKNNVKALSELGLEPSDVKMSASGRLDVSSPEIQEAMYRFVDQAVLRPSASNRPVWMSDPRFQLIAHLKQFTYAMHNVVLKRASRELGDDNVKPWAILALTMPVILASDMAKFALTGGLPSSWGFMDYLKHAVERSGLLGLGDFTLQATRGVGQGGAPGEGLLGPAAEHLLTILRWIMGDQRTDFGDVIDRTIPGARFI